MSRAKSGKTGYWANFQGLKIGRHQIAAYTIVVLLHISVLRKGHLYTKETGGYKFGCLIIFCDDILLTCSFAKKKTVIFLQNCLVNFPDTFRKYKQPIKRKG